MQLHKKTILPLIITTIISLDSSTCSSVLGQTNYTISNKRTLNLTGTNGWNCQVRSIVNHRYFGIFKVVGWNCSKGEREIEDSNEMANQCAVFDVRQQLNNSYDKSRTHAVIDCQEKMIKFNDSTSDSKRIWKSAGWYKMRIGGKWSEFSESKLKEICNNAVISDSDALYIAACPSITSQDFYTRFQVEGKTSKDDAFIDSGNNDGKDINEENKKSHNDKRLPWPVNDIVTAIYLFGIPLIIVLLLGSSVLVVGLFKLFQRKK